MKNPLIAAVICIALMSTGAVAQVADMPDGPYGGQFRDVSTGKVWLDLDVLGIRNLTERQAYLSTTPFRLATRTEIENLVQYSLDAALSWQGHRCFRLSPGQAPDECNMAIFDDSAAGVDASRPGLAGAEVRGSQTSFASQNDATDDGGTSYWGTWAVQRAPALCATSDAYSVDLNCDGKDEKVVWRSATGTWYVRFSGSNELLTEQWGLPGDHPILGDYDGDHIADLAVWRPSNGTWYVKTSSSLFDASQAVVQQFGLPGDVPMRGDYDGDGIFDYAVWRPSDGNWYVLRSSDHQAVVEQWGLPGDVPVTGGRSPQ